MEVAFDFNQDGGVQVCGPIGTPSHMHLAGSDGSQVTAEPAASVDMRAAAIMAANVGGVGRSVRPRSRVREVDYDRPLLVYSSCCPLAVPCTLVIALSSPPDETGLYCTSSCSSSGRTPRTKHHF